MSLSAESCFSLSQPHLKLLELLIQVITWKLDSEGKFVIHSEKKSSVMIRVLDEDKTKKQLSSLVLQWEKTYPNESLSNDLSQIIKYIKQQYLSSHSGFRQRKNSGVELQLKVDEIYAVSKVAEFAFEFAGKSKKERNITIGIGLIRQGIQDAGKNLIKAVWQSAGYKVIDFGCNLTPDELSNAAVKSSIAALGISCMTHSGARNLIKLAELWKKLKTNIPIIVGGIAVNPHTVKDLGLVFDLRLSYGRDATEAVEVLEHALSGKNYQVDVACTNSVSLSRQLPENIRNIGRKWGFELYDLPIQDVCISKTARAGCTDCPPEKRDKCPIVLGFEKEHTIEESEKFIGQFSRALLVKSGLPELTDTKSHIIIWNTLLDIESWIRKSSKRVYTFRFPLPCPFCSEKDCTLSKGHCQNSHLYRSISESYLIDITSTVAKSLGTDRFSGMFSLILYQ